MRAVLILLLMFTMLACSSAKKGSSGNKKKSELTQSLRLDRKEGSSKIIFLTFGIWVQDSVRDEYGFTKKGELYADGSVKVTPMYDGPYEPYQLYWQTRDAENKTVETGKMPDPLYQSFETSDPQTGRMERHLVSSQSGEIVLRFNLNDNTRLISIFKLSDGKLKKLYEASIL